ncbi:MAG: hypothetical protein ACLVC4_10175 [Gordonibacter urolithinfaciens]
MVRAAQAAEGEVWSPQLPPYRAWASRDEAGAGGQGRQGADGDLLVVGALGMGLSDEEREKLLAHAAERGGAEERIGKDGAAPFPSAGPTAPARERMGDDLRGALRVRQDADGTRSWDSTCAGSPRRREATTAWWSACPRSWTACRWCA